MQVEEKIIPKVHTLSGFDNSSVVTKGEVTLTTFAEGIAKDTKFQVVEMEMAYNMILGRPWIHEMDAVPSTLHQVIKFPSPWGICQIRGDQHTSRAINSVADTSTRSEGATYQRLVTRMFQEYLGKTMELNPEKCAFGVTSGKFLGFLVSNRGIEVNTTQIKAIEEIPDILSNKKEVQRNLKTYLSNPPLLAKPKAGEKLLIYLAVSEVTVSSVLVREEQGKQSPIYYVSKSLLDVDTRTAVKSQVLTDFVADFSYGIQLEAEKELQVFNGANPGTWTLFTDGSSNVRGAGLGVVLVPPTGETILQAIKCHSITNNEVEYEAMIAGFELARELGIRQIIIKSDSQLVVNQILGTYTAREARMQQYLEKVWELIKQFQDWKIRQIPRDENLEADALANLASAADVTNDANTSVIHLFHSVIDPDANEVNFNNLTWDWKKEIMAFLQYGTVPDDKKKACALRRKAARYCLKQGNLYRKMFGGPLARCLGPAQTEYVMREVHKGHCGNHAGGRSLVRTLIRAGYY
ncbi:uncharacterized protein [Nicotiana sylvestris]|uniref:uncharacterized protein n=1 Tax=Nicotiana sylvestris TaxID=4096 RepID=UPI00388C7692